MSGVLKTGQSACYNYWSSTTYQFGPNLAWGVNFFDGFVSSLRYGPTGLLRVGGSR